MSIFMYMYRCVCECVCFRSSRSVVEIPMSRPHWRERFTPQRLGVCITVMRDCASLGAYHTYESDAVGLCFVK